jgi:polysaccharide export outer membrane protein
MIKPRIIMLVMACLLGVVPLYAQVPEPRPPAATGAAAPSPTAADATADAYVVGPQDVLTVTVFGEAELSGKFPIEADGGFNFPLIGRVSAGGRTLRQVEETIRGKLADGYLKNPQLTVSVEQYRSQRIFIVGEVRNPGTYPLTGQMTLVEALATAGSAGANAADHALVVRGGNGRVAGAEDGRDDVVRIDLRAFQAGSLAHNIALRDGDTIIVPQAETVFVFGQVNSPGAYPISKNTTVLQALALAGGVTTRGSTSRIRIVRVVNGQEQEVRADLGNPVRPGDTIIVRERFF